MEHRTQTDLENAIMTSDVKAFKTPEGHLFGAGKTVPTANDIWAPGAIFVHTDGTSFGTTLYRNIGTKAAVDFTALGISETETKAADFTLTANDSGKTFVIDAADVVATLPSTVAGLIFTFAVKTLSVTTGFKAKAAAADNINGGTDGQSFINSAATDAVGDAITLVGDGTVGWFTVSKVGTWAAGA